MINDVISDLNNQYTSTLYKYDRCYNAKKELELAIKDDHDKIDNLNKEYIDTSKIINKKDVVITAAILLSGVGILLIKFPPYIMPYAIGTGVFTILGSTVFLIKEGVSFISSNIKNKILSGKIEKIEQSIKDKKCVLEEEKEKISLIKSEIHSLKLKIENEEKNILEHNLILENDNNIDNKNDYVEEKEKKCVKRLIKNK